MSSLKGRLALGLTLSLLALFLVQWWMTSAALDDLTEEFVVSRLDHDAENLLGALRVSENERIELNPLRIGGIYQQPFSGHYYVVDVDGVALYSRSLWDFDLVVPSSVGQHSLLPGPDDQHLFMVVRMYQKGGHEVRISVAEDMTPLTRNINNFLVDYSLAAFLMIVAVILLQWMLVKTGLKPLDRVRGDMMRLERGEMLRLSEDVPVEVRPLVMEFNRLLDVMKGQLGRSRTAMGNLAHALKTPLTVLGRLEDEEALQQHPEIHQELIKQVTNIRQLTDRQLKRARMAGTAALGLQFYPREEFIPLIDMLQRIYMDDGIEINASIPAQKMFSGDREDMMELFGNLLENACKWAKSQVLLTVADEAGLVVVIEDDGPGCPPEQRQKLAQRGVRIDESTLGHGLGLSIVSEIVQHYGGTLSFDESAQLGGFKVSVNLPDRQPAH